MSKTVMISAGETSGELYGALLATSLKKKLPSIRIIGTGGEQMKAAGVEILSGISSAFGLAEAISSVKAVHETLKRATEAIQRERPSVLVLIDYPDFNLRLAAEARIQNVPILYYVSPQVWAWRKKRVNKIARLVDKMAVVLPFEEEIYKIAGLACEFVGHPIYDEIREMDATTDQVKKTLGLRHDIPLLSLLPGSRPHEIKRLLPVITAVVRDAKKELGLLQFCVPFAPNTDIQLYSRSIAELREEGVLITKGDSLRALAASDYTVIASGTASLQAVLLGVPAVVIYKLFPLTYWLGKMIIKVKHISLVNILSEREVVKELLQSDATSHNIIAELRELMNNRPARERMLESYGKVRQMFAGKHATERVTDMVIQMAGWQQ